MGGFEADVTDVDGAGALELLADADRPGGWVLLLDRIRQSYVDLDDPTYLDFEYMQCLAEVIDALAPGPLRVAHIGGGACTLARYVAATRPGSAQVVFEPNATLTALVRVRLPFPRGTRPRVRAFGGREGVARLAPGRRDAIVLDAFSGGRVPAELGTAEFAAEAARALTPTGVLLANVADQEMHYTRRLVAALGTALPHVLVRADPAVLKRRRFGNVTLVASRAQLPTADLARSAAGAMFPQRVLAGAGLDRFVAGAAPFTDADARRSPAPPEEAWRVG